MKFKVGDRVKIDCPKSSLHGREGVIWDIASPAHWAQVRVNEGATGDAHRIDVAGFGRRWPEGYYVGFEAHELKPIQPLGSWEELKRMCGKDIREPEMV